MRPIETIAREMLETTAREHRWPAPSNEMCEGAARAMQIYAPDRKAMISAFVAFVDLHVKPKAEYEFYG